MSSPRRFPSFKILQYGCACIAAPCFSASAKAEIPPTAALSVAMPLALETSWSLESASPQDQSDQIGLAPIAAPLADVDEPQSEGNVASSYGPHENLDQPSKAQYSTFIGRVGAVKWEVAGIFALLTATNIGKVIKEPQSFRFQDEGFFGKDTADLGVDKLAHAYNSYLLSEILYRRMERKTGGGVRSAVTAAVLGSGLQLYGEVYDGLHAGSGFSLGDVAFNISGAAFSVARNSIPGLKDKLDFRIMIVPNSDFYTYQGKRHFEQEHFLLALKLAGFNRFRNSPLRFVELHVGYHAKDFTIPDRLAGVEPKRLPFIGVGFNFLELLKGRRSGLAKAAHTTLQYLQLPYTSIHVDTPTGRLSP